MSTAKLQLVADHNYRDEFHAK